MNFEKFNNKNDSRDYIKNPFLIGDKIYYTNGKIILRTDFNNEKIDYIDESNVKVKNTVLEIFKDKDFDKQVFLKMPVLPEIKYIECSKCKGSGKDLTCHECNGETEVTVSNKYHEYTMECKTCSGSGCVETEKTLNECYECEKCNGSGLEYDYDNNYITLFDKDIDLEIANLIKDLPNLKISYQNGHFVFKFDGGDGVFKESFN